MKRVIALTLALVLTFALAACGVSAPNEESAPSFDVPEATVNPDGSISYALNTKMYSHWKFAESGDYVYLSDTLIDTDDDWYYFKSDIKSDECAFIVIDPWIDWADPFLNDYFGKITAAKTLPLIQAAAAKAHPVFIMTNNPDGRKTNTKVDPGFQALADAGKAELLYHSDFTSESFAEYLKAKGIKTLVYTGYASNLCVLTRDVGICPMSKQGFKLIFVPECSGAIERADTWDSQQIHNDVTLVISQSMAQLASFNELMAALS